MSSASRRRPRRPRLGPAASRSRSTAGGSFDGGGIPSAARSAVCLPRPRRRVGARCGSSGAASCVVGSLASEAGAAAMPGERRPRRRVVGRCGSSGAASCVVGSFASSEAGAAATPGERRPRRRDGVRCGSSGAASCTGASLVSSGAGAAAMPGERRPRRGCVVRWGSSGTADASLTASADGAVSGAPSAVRRRVVLRRRGLGPGPSDGSACWGSCTISSDLSSQRCRLHRAECCSSTCTAPRTYSAVVATL